MFSVAHAMLANDMNHLINICTLPFSFSQTRHPTAAERAAQVSRCPHGVTDLAHPGIAGLLPTARRGWTGLQQEFGQASQKPAAETQGTTTEVSWFWTWHCLYGTVELTLRFLYRREQWPMFSSYSCWQQLVNQTKSLSKDHAALSEIYSVHLVARLQSVWDDVQRIYRKVSSTIVQTTSRRVLKMSRVCFMNLIGMSNVP